MQQKVRIFIVQFTLYNIILIIHFIYLEEQDAYHSIQFDFDLQDGLIIEEKSNKRSYFDDDEKDLAYYSNKKVNLNNNEEIRYHEIGYQYMQRNYTTN
ncbi:unnamed protein product [Rhizophagus irregularis]|nr:unnamed protein product [Rhizophagus irregularis]